MPVSEGVEIHLSLADKADRKNQRKLGQSNALAFRNVVGECACFELWNIANLPESFPGIWKIILKV